MEETTRLLRIHLKKMDEATRRPLTDESLLEILTSIDLMRNLFWELIHGYVEGTKGTTLQHRVKVRRLREEAGKRYFRLAKKYELTL